MYPFIDFSWSPRHSWLFSVESVPVPGSFAVQFGDHLRYGDHLRAGIICGAVDLVCLFNHDQNEKFSKFLNYQIAVKKIDFYTKIASCRLIKLQLRTFFCKRALQFSAVVHAFISQQTNHRRKVCYYNWLSFLTLKTAGRNANVRYWTWRN